MAAFGGWSAIWAIFWLIVLGVGATNADSNGDELPFQLAMGSSLVMLVISLGLIGWALRSARSRAKTTGVHTHWLATGFVPGCAAGAIAFASIALYAIIGSEPQ